MCCSDTQGWLGFPWPLCLKRGWAKRCSTLPWPVSGWSLQFVFFFLLPARPNPGGARLCQGCACAPRRARPALDVAPPGLHCASRGGRKTAAISRRPGERPPSCAHSRGLRDTPQAMGSLPRLQCQQYTARSAKDPSNNNPLRSGRGLGAPSPQAVHQPMPATPGTSVPCLHAQCLRPTSADRQDRRPPEPGRDRAAVHQDAGKPLCGRVQRRGYTPARAQAPPAGAQRRALALTPESRPAVSCDALQGGSTARRRTGAGRAAPRLGAGRLLLGKQPSAARRAAPRQGQGGETILAVGEERDAM